MKKIALFIGTILGFCLPLANAQDGDIIMNNSGALESITEDPRYFYDPGGKDMAGRLWNAGFREQIEWIE